ncbi:MAG: hypothetical protein Devi2KO_40390 [Devosia indica]
MFFHILLKKQNKIVPLWLISVSCFDSSLSTTEVRFEDQKKSTWSEDSWKY